MARAWRGLQAIFSWGGAGVARAWRGRGVGMPSAPLVPLSPLAWCILQTTEGAGGMYTPPARGRPLRGRHNTPRRDDAFSLFPTAGARPGRVDVVDERIVHLSNDCLGPLFAAGNASGWRERKKGALVE
eukprot:gene8891-biopygen3170